MTSSRVEELRIRLSDMHRRLRAAGLRPNWRHDRVLEVIVGGDRALTAAEVFSRMIDKEASAAQTAVYRALYAMEAHGVLQRDFVTVDRRAVAAYRLTTDESGLNLPVLVCPRCHRSVALAGPGLQAQLMLVAEAAGMAISDHRITVGSVCRNCAEEAGAVSHRGSVRSRPGPGCGIGAALR